ncbi:hypothetical protein FRC03_009218, partial [Tulasnella sp. 419]
MEYLKDFMHLQRDKHGGEQSSGQPLDSASHSASPIKTIKNSSIFWDHYVKEADLYDTEMVKGIAGDLDTLLIFAGLFSAVNTAFIVEAYKDLKPDPMAATNVLIQQLINTNNGTFSGSGCNEASFVARTGSVRACQLFFSSLSCSLLAAFGAVLGKQWLNEYQRYGKQRSPLDRGIQRHGKFLGMYKYHFVFVIQTLPTLLQFSLFLFLAALVRFLWLIHSHVAAVVIGFLGAAFLLWFITTLISTFDSTSPFSTRLSAQLHRLVKKKKNETTNTPPSSAVTI